MTKETQTKQHVANEEPKSAFGLHPFETIDTGMMATGRSQPAVPFQMQPLDSVSAGPGLENSEGRRSGSISAKSVFHADGALDLENSPSIGMEIDQNSGLKVAGTVDDEPEIEGKEKSTPSEEVPAEGESLKISHSTIFSAPDGSANTRDSIGVGETVVFSAAVSGTWTASSGSPLTKGRGKKFRWKAPAQGGEAKVTLNSGEQEGSISLKVIEPQGITSKKLQEKPMPAGAIGAGMYLKYRLAPLNVSFGNVSSKEVSGPPSNISGFFGNVLPANLWHDSGDTFFPYAADNWHDARDEAAIEFPPSITAPLDPGHFEWVIPNNFRLSDETGGGTHFTNVVQEFDLAADGTMTVNKAGQTVSRKP